MLLALVGAAAGLQPTARIVNGAPAPPAGYPYQITLQERAAGVWSHSCGGSLLSPAGWVLTAAHCFIPLVAISEYRVGIYRHNLSLPSALDHACAEYIGVSELMPHPLYNDGNKDNDVALLKLTRVPRCALPSAGADYDANMLVRLDGEASASLALDGSAEQPGSDYTGVVTTVAGWGALYNEMLKPFVCTPLGGEAYYYDSDASDVTSGLSCTSSPNYPPAGVTTGGVYPRVLQVLTDVPQVTSLHTHHHAPAPPATSTLPSAARVASPPR